MSSRQMERRLDSRKSKIPMDMQVFGKARVFIKNNSLHSTQNLSKECLGLLMNKDVEEPEINKFFDQINREEQMNEYNKTEIGERTGVHNKKNVSK